MDSSVLYPLLADALLVLHASFAVFVVLGLFLILLGKLRSWHWVRNPWFRFAHLLGIGFVVIQSWFGAICPLTQWEMALRLRAGERIYQGSFIRHWLSELLYYQAPAWVFVFAYSAFGLLVILSWFWVRPRKFRE